MYRELAAMMVLFPVLYFNQNNTLVCYLFQKMHFEGRGNVTVKSEDDGPPLVLAVHQQPPGVGLL